MSKLIVRGPLLTHSGYGYHSRQFVHWARDMQNKGHFDQVTFQVLNWGITPWMLNSEDTYDDSIIRYIMSNSESGKMNYGDASIQIQLPHEWDPNIAKFNIGVTAGVETDRVSPKWVQDCFKMDRVIVPSKFSKQSFLKSAANDYERKRLKKRITVVNEAYHPSLLSSEKSSLSLSKLPEKNFLLFGQITGTDASNDRKNTFNAIKWFIEEWGNDPNVGLVIKTNSGKNTTIDRKITYGKLDSCVREVTKLCDKEETPRIFLMHGAMTEEEKRDLYTSPKISALLMPTRGEGYGLPVLEAALLGLPIIAPAHSGYMDFAKSLIDPIEYCMTPVPQNRIDNLIFVQGAHWAESSESSCKKKMHDAISRTNNRSINDTIKKNLSVDAVVENLSKKYTKKGELLR